MAQAGWKPNEKAASEATALVGWASQGKADARALDVIARVRREGRLSGLRSALRLFTRAGSALNGVMQLHALIARERGRGKRRG